MSTTHNDKKPRTVTITIDKLVYKGWGLGDHDGFKIFVPNTLPGDTVTAKITKRKRRYAEAKLIDIITPSQLRTQSICTHFRECGGCQIIDTTYQTQLQLKQDILNDCAQQFFPQAQDLIQPIIGCETNTYYRNKMDYAFGTENNQIICGLKKRGTFDTVINTQECLLQSKQANLIKQAVANWCTQHNLTAWDYHTNTGLMRHLQIRHSKTTDSYMLNIITSEKHLSLFQELATQLNTQFKEISGIYLSINPHTGDRNHFEDITLLSGDPTLTETLDTLTYTISPQSFFQTNTKQAEILYKKTLELTQPDPQETLLDLYCGTGTIGLFFAPHVDHVTGIEEIPQAIEDAKKNAQQNNITNASFICGRVKNILKFESFSPDIVIVDPPRSGLVPKALKRTLELNAPKLTYVSCAPPTFFRDLKTMTEYGYKIDTIQPVDMFPNTFHIETITTLKKI